MASHSRFPSVWDGPTGCSLLGAKGRARERRLKEGNNGRSIKGCFEHNEGRRRVIQ